MSHIVSIYLLHIGRTHLIACSSRLKISLWSNLGGNVLPVLNFFGLQIPTYFFWISFLSSCAVVWTYRRAAQFQLSRGIALDLGLVIMITGLIGGRALHVLYEAPEVYREVPMGIFYLWKGGFVYYGGALLSFACSWIYLKYHKQSFELWLNFFAPVMCLMYGFGRIGCFLAGCCYGKFCELPWAVAGRHPTQLYAFAWEFGLLLILLGREQTKKFKLSGSNHFLLWASLSSLGRILMESFRDDFRGPSPVLSISSWISLFVLLVCGSVLLIQRLEKSQVRSKL